MKQDYDNMVEQAIEEMRNMRYDGKVDVVDAVMEQVRKRPIMVAPKPYKRYAFIAAACTVLAVGIGVVSVIHRNATEAQISDMFAQVYDYNASYGTIEQCAYAESDVATLLIGE